MRNSAWFLCIYVCNPVNRIEIASISLKIFAHFHSVIINVVSTISDEFRYRHTLTHFALVSFLSAKLCHIYHWRLAFWQPLSTYLMRLFCHNVAVVIIMSFECVRVCVRSRVSVQFDDIFVASQILLLLH